MNGAQTLGASVDSNRRQTATGRRSGKRHCPRCNGNLFVSREDYATAWHCLQCGREFVPAPVAAPSTQAA